MENVCPGPCAKYVDSKEWGKENACQSSCTKYVDSKEVVRRSGSEGLKSLWACATADAPFAMGQRHYGQPAFLPKWRRRVGWGFFHPGAVQHRDAPGVP